MADVGGETQPLGGADIFHLRTDAELRAHRGGRNVCVLVAVTDGKLDADRLRARIAAGPPELSWRLGRSLKEPWVWRPSTERMEVVEKSLPGDPVDTALELLGEPVSGRHPWRLVVLRGGDHDAVALVWFHCACDARAASRLLRYLGHDDPWPEEPFGSSDRLIAQLDPADRRALRQAYIQHAVAVGHRPIVSLRTASDRRPAGPAALRVRLTREDTAAFDGSLRRRAGLADTSLITWAATRVFARLLAARGHSPPRHLVPVPLSLDPKRGAQRLFGNNLTMMLMHLDPEVLGDEARAVASLAQQRRAIVRQKLDAGMIAAMKSTGWMPWPVVNWLSRRPFGGERASFVLSNPGRLELDTFQDRNVTDAFALPMVLTTPGLQITADRHGDRLSVMFLYRERLTSAAELERERDAFVADLLGHPS